MEFKNCINYLLTGAQHEVFQLISEKLLPYDVTPGQYGVLNCLWRQEATTPKDMARVLGLETTTVSGVLDRMQKKGLIERDVDPNDRRCVHVRLTERGMALERPVLSVVDEVNHQVWSLFPKEDADKLASCLRVIIQKKLT